MWNCYTECTPSLSYSVNDSPVLTKVATPAWTTHVKTMGHVSSWELPMNVNVQRDLADSTVKQVRKTSSGKFCKPAVKLRAAYFHLIICTFDYCLLSSGVEQLLKCLYHNGQCEHFCDGSGRSRKCFCANGYKLAADRQQCIKEGNNHTHLQALLTITM